MAVRPAFYVYKDRGGAWRWSLVAGNSRIVADSAEGYISRPACLTALARVGELVNDPAIHIHDEPRSTQGGCSEGTDHGREHAPGESQLVGPTLLERSDGLFGAPGD